MSQSVMRKKLFAIFKVKVTGRAHMIKTRLSTISSELLILRQPNLVWWYIIISRSVLWKKLNYCIQGQGHSKGSKCQCLSGWYLIIARNFVTKLGIVMHHHELGCQAKRLVSYLQDQSYSEGSSDENMTVSTIFSELLTPLLPNFVW